MNLPMYCGFNNPRTPLLGRAVLIHYRLPGLLQLSQIVGIWPWHALWHHWLRCVETDWSEQLGLYSNRVGGELYYWHPSMNDNDSSQQFYLGERSEAQSQRLASTARRLISRSLLQSTRKALDSLGMYTWFTLMVSLGESATQWRRRSYYSCGLAERTLEVLFASGRTIVKMAASP